MSKEIADFTEYQLRGAFTGMGLSPEDVDRAIKDYQRYREGELKAIKLLSLLSGLGWI